MVVGWVPLVLATCLAPRPPSAALQRASGDPRRGFHRSTLWSIPTLGLRTALDHNRDGLSRDRIAGARFSAEIRCTADGWTRIVGSTGRGQREKLGRKPAPKVSPCVIGPTIVHVVTRIVKHTIFMLQIPYDQLFHKLVENLPPMSPLVEQ